MAELKASECWEIARKSYESGKINEAVEICEMPVCSEVMECQRFLGWASYSYGGGQLDRAIMWFSLAAEQQDSYSIYCLGMTYYRKESYKEAARYLKKAVELEIYSVCFRLGYMYQHGMGVLKDEAIAEEYYKKGAEHGFFAAEKAAIELAYKNSSMFKRVFLLLQKIRAAIRIFFVAIKDINDERLVDTPQKHKEMKLMDIFIDKKEASV